MNDDIFNMTVIASIALPMKTWIHRMVPIQSIPIMMLKNTILKVADQYGYRKKAIVIQTDIEICRRRAVETGQEDLIPVIEKMAENFEEISENEGFDEVRQIDLRTCLKQV